MRCSTAGALGLALLVRASAAKANGRFPAAQHIVVGADHGDGTVIALRTTFGVLSSHDNGNSFHWLCESSLQVSGGYDPTIDLDLHDTLLVGLMDGLTRTADGCAVDRDVALEGALIADLAHSGDHVVTFALESGVGGMGHLWRADDGAAFAPRWSLPSEDGFFTVDAAPSDPDRVYLSGIDYDSGAPLLFRSTDRGDNFTATTATFEGAVDAYIAGVDPVNPDRVWIRGHTEASTALYASDDGGATAHMLYPAHGALLGFAVSDDGQRIWIGGPDDGLLRSTDGGASFLRVSPLHVMCLRYANGALYVCTDWLRDDMAVARWIDGEAAPSALLRFEDVAGPASCAPPSAPSELCAGEWSAQRSLLQPSAPDAGMEGGAVTIDAEMDGGSDPPPPASNCNCRTTRADVAPHGWLVTFVVFATERRRRRRRQQSS